MGGQMSCLCYCDEDECQNTENDMKLYDISWPPQKPLADFLRNDGHICKECLDYWLVDYPGLVIEDDTYGVLMNPDFKDEK